MGESVTNKPSSTTGSNNGGAEISSTVNTTGQRDGNRHTESGGTGRGGTGGRGTGGKSSTEKTGVPKLVTVEDGKPMTPPTPKKDEGVSKRTLQRRAAKEKAKAEGKTPTAAATKNDLKIKADNLKPHIAMVLVVAFDYLAKPLGEHWKVTAEEAARVADPLSNILAQYMKANEAMEKYADWIGVLTALSIIVIPRMLMQQAINAQQKKKGGQLHVANSNTANGKLDAGTMRTNEGTGTNTKRSTNNQSTTGGGNWTSDVLTAIAPY